LGEKKSRAFTIYEKRDLKDLDCRTSIGQWRNFVIDLMINESFGQDQPAHGVLPK